MLRNLCLCGGRVDLSFLRPLRFYPSCTAVSEIPFPKASLDREPTAFACHRRLYFPWVLGLFWPALTSSSVGCCLLHIDGECGPAPPHNVSLAPKAISFSTERVPNNCIGGSGTVTALVLRLSYASEALPPGSGVPNSDIGGSGVATYFMDGISPRRHLPALLSSLSAGAPISLLDLVGIGVPVTTSSSRELSQHWYCAVLRSPSPCPLFQTEHFDLAPWHRHVAPPRGRVPKRCIGGSGTSTGLRVSTCSAPFFEVGVGVFLTRSFAQRKHVPPDSSLGHPPKQSVPSPFLRICPVLPRPRCTEAFGHAFESFAEELLCPFFRHLALVICCSLLGLLLRSFKAHGTPLGGLVLLPTKGIPQGLLRPAAVWSVSQRDVAVQIALPLLPGRRRTRQHTHCAMPLRPGLMPHLRIWFWCCLLPSAPIQVWAAPPSLREDVSAIGRLAASLPERLGPPVPLVDRTTIQEDLRTSMLQQSLNHDLARPLENADELPVPPLRNVPEVGQPTAPFFQGVCYAMAPQYQAEVLWLTLRAPLDLAAFNHAVREALRSLRLPFCYVIAPTVPQLGPDFASIVLVPKWLPQAGRQLIVHDFRPVGGPVYAGITLDNVTHQDCEREAVSLGYRQTSIYVQYNL